MLLGGELKTIEDQESITAKFFTDKDIQSMKESIRYCCNHWI